MTAAVSDGRLDNHREEDRSTRKYSRKAHMQRPCAQGLRKPIAFGEVKALTDDSTSGNSEAL